MNDEFNPKHPAEDWEMSLPEILTAKKDSSVQTATEESMMPSQSFSQPKAETAEDWGMTNPLTPPSDMPVQQSGWQLPDPVFRCSKGSTPEKFSKSPQADVQPPAEPEKTLENPAELFGFGDAPPISPKSAVALIPGSAPTNPAKSALPIAAPAVNIEPQPDISEVFVSAPNAVLQIEKSKPKNKILRVILTVSGILLMFAVAVGFLILVYYLFFHKSV